MRVKTACSCAALLSIGALFAAGDVPAGTNESREAQIRATVQRVLDETPLIDGHNDLPGQLYDRVRNHLDRLALNADTSLLDPPMQTDIPRLRRGRMGGVFLAAFVPPRLEPAAATRALFGQITMCAESRALSTSGSARSPLTLSRDGLRCLGETLNAGHQVRTLVLRLFDGGYWWCLDLMLVATGGRATCAR
jgi:hypothetical protein